jgi:uncharacterized protein with GYD domain
MVRYLTLIQLTNNGIREIGDSASRAAAFASEVAKAGGKVIGQYWAVGQYDGAVVFEAPDEETATSLLLQLAREGFVRTQSQRLFNAEEFQAVLAK